MIRPTRRYRVGKGRPRFVDARRYRGDALVDVAGHRAGGIEYDHGVFIAGGGHTLPDRGHAGDERRRYSKAADCWNSHVVTDGLLITGQNPASSAEAARALLKQFA